MFSGSIASRRALVLVAAGLLAACQQPTSVEFDVIAPTNSFLDPFSLSVSDYVLKSADGSILAAVSAGASKDGHGRLSIGALAPTLTGDLQLNVMSGPELVGIGAIEQVAVEKGKALDFSTQVRKPLVVVGAADFPEAPVPTATMPAGAHAAPRLLDLTTSTDLQTIAKAPQLPDEQAAAFTADGQHLFLGSAAGLYVFDTGSGVTSGPTKLAFAPSLVAIAPGDAGVAFIERGATVSAGSRVSWYRDVAGLIASPSSATATSATIMSGLPRAAHFSEDGGTLYVLVEADGDEPCTGTATPGRNSIVSIGTDGTLGAAITMPSYVADFSIEADGSFVLAASTANEIDVLVPPSTTAQKLYSNVACPSALRLVDDHIYVVTNDTSVSKADFGLMIGHTDGSSPTTLPMAMPTYQISLTDPMTSDGKTNDELQFTPVALVAYELAVSPDEASAVFATRARYRELPTSSYQFAGLDCMDGFDIVEYGLYSVDLGTGTAAYTMRSQTVITQNADAQNDCVFCSSDLLGVELPLACVSSPGDRAAGLAASFSGVK